MILRNLPLMHWLILRSTVKSESFSPITEQQSGVRCGELVQAAEGSRKEAPQVAVGRCTMSCSSVKL